MAHTFRRDDREGKVIRDGDDNMHRYRKECKEVRVRHSRMVRKRTRQMIREGEFDALPEYPHTSGWETN